MEDRVSVEGSESVSLVLKEGTLPATADELVPLCLVAEAVVKAYNAKINAMKRIEAMNDQLEATYDDGLEIARLLFLAYQRLGDLVEQNTASPLQSGRAGGKAVPMENSLPNVGKLAKRLGISRKRLEDAKTIARDPQYIDTVVDAARKQGVLPSRTKLLAVIRAGKPGKASRKRASMAESKHAAIERSNKLLASRTLAEKCTDALVEATSYMKAIVELWGTIPDAERADLAKALFELQGYSDQLRARYAPDIERKGA